jgi:hypothetical protein
LESFCYAHTPGAKKSSDWELEYDSLKPHVACLCSAKVKIHPHVSNFIYRENSEDDNLPPVVKHLLRRDVPDYYSFMAGRTSQDMQRPDYFPKDVFSINFPPVLDYEDDVQEEEEDVAVLRLRRSQWKHLFETRIKERVETLSRNKDKVATGDDLIKVLSMLSCTVPKNQHNKRGRSLALMLFYKKEVERRTKPCWKRSGLMKWNMAHLVQMMKVRFRRKYSNTIIKLYAKDPNSS